MSLVFACSVCSCDIHGAQFSGASGVLRRFDLAGLILVFSQAFGGRVCVFLWWFSSVLLCQAVWARRCHVAEVRRWVRLHTMCVTRTPLNAIDFSHLPRRRHICWRSHLLPAGGLCWKLGPHLCLGRLFLLIIMSVGVRRLFLANTISGIIAVFILPQPPWGVCMAVLPRICCLLRHWQVIRITTTRSAQGRSRVRMWKNQSFGALPMGTTRTENLLWCPEILQPQAETSVQWWCRVMARRVCI